MTLSLRKRATAMSTTGFVLAALFALGCASTAPQPGVFTELPDAPALYAEGEAEVARQKARRIMRPDYTTAIEVFQDIIDNYPYSEQAVMAELAIADAYYEQEGYEEAISYYQDFVDLHPEHPRVAYSIYRTALSHRAQSKGPGRDQSETTRAIAALETLLVRYPHSSYAEEGEAILIEMRQRLARHAIRVGDFYFKMDEFPSAAERYRDVLNRFPGLGIDAEALYKLGLCYTRMNREDEAHDIFQVILDNYESSEVADAAADLIPAAN